MYGLDHIEFKKDKADKAFGFGSSIIAADRVGSYFSQRNRTAEPIDILK